MYYVAVSGGVTQAMVVVPGNKRAAAGGAMSPLGTGAGLMSPIGPEYVKAIKAAAAMAARAAALEAALKMQSNPASGGDSSATASPAAVQVSI